MSDLAYLISNTRIVSCLVPGAMMCVFINNYFRVDFLKNDALFNIIIFYAVGVVIGRVGSIVIEPFFKNIGLIEKDNYARFIEAEERNPKLNTIDEICRFYRSLVALMIIIIVGLIVSFFLKMYSLWISFGALIAAILILVLMVFAYRKQSKYTIERINKVLEEKQ